MALPRALVPFAAGMAAGHLVARAAQSAPARMAGSTFAAPDAAPWVTDLLNAACCGRDPAGRDVDLRLAQCILTTRWNRLGHRRLRGPGVMPFHAALGRDRLRGGARGTLDGAHLPAGAERLPGLAQRTAAEAGATA